MSSSILHRCPQCGYETEISSSLSAFAEDPHCRQCGLSASEGDAKMQEELSTLFARNMMVNNRPEFEQTEPSSAWKMQQQIPTPPANPITYSITQHYHHSAHQAQAARPQRPTDHLHGHLSSEDVLVQNNINPSSLTLAQLTLVQQANQDELLQLIEQWRASHPNPEHDRQTAGIGDAAMEQGEDIGMEGVEDGTRNLNIHSAERNTAEPYMLSGYEALAKREYDKTVGAQPFEGLQNTYSPLGSAVGGNYEQRTDPAYDSRGWWQHSMERQPMEHQYGAFQQLNDFNMTNRGGVRDDILW